MTRFAQLVSILAAGLLLAEAVARWIFPVPDVVNFERSRFTPFFSAELARQTSLSNATFVYPSEPDGAESVHELNLYGFRDRDWDLEHDPSIQRILFVGDSYVEGFLTPASSTIPSTFEARAREKGAPPIETLNLGIGALGPGGYARLISDAVPLFTPEFVVLVLYANDIAIEPFQPRFRRSPDVVEKRPESRLFGVVQKMLHGESVARSWRSKPMNFFAPVPSSSNPWSNPMFAKTGGKQVSPKLAAAMSAGLFNPLVTGEVEEYAAMLTARPHMEKFLFGANRFAASHGAQLLVAYLPGRNQVTDFYLTYHAQYSLNPPPPSLIGPEFQRHAATLATQCAKMTIPFLDLTPIVRSHEDRGEHLYWNYDSHMSPTGYTVIGEALFDWAEDRLKSN